MKSASLRGYRRPCASFLPMATHRWVLYLQTNHGETLNLPRSRAAWHWLEVRRIWTPVNKVVLGLGVNLVRHMLVSRPLRRLMTAT
mgnify:CR=1 FL=1